MSMSDSDSGYTVIDLDSPAANTNAPELEIVNEGGESGGEIEIVETQTEQPEPKPAAKSVPEPESDDEDGADDGERRKLTRSQRLKNARDAANQRAAEAEARVKDLETRLAKREKEAEDGAAIGLDLVVQTLEDRIAGLRHEYNAALDSGDRDKLWDVQRKISAFEAQKEATVRERRAYPTRPTSGGEVQPPVPTTTTTQARPPEQISGTPSRRAVEWGKANADWWNKDRRMTRRALVIDAELIEDGYSPDDEDYWEALDAALVKEFPDKFSAGGPVAKTKPRVDPTVQNRAPAAPVGGKVRVTITAADREMADKLGISVQDYAKQKVLYERSQNTAAQYTEIL